MVTERVLFGTISNMTGSFIDDVEDLINIGNGEIAFLSVSRCLLKCHEIGERKFEEFISLKVKADNPDICTPS